MEQITQERILFPEAQKQRRLPKLSPLSLIVFTLLVGFAVIGVGMRALALHSVPPPDPFAEYADILPGQPASAIQTQPFTCAGDYNHNYSDSADPNCTLAPTTGDFMTVRVIISGGTIHQTEFVIRDDALQVGALEAMLGTGNFTAKPYGVVFSWHGTTALASTFAGKRHSSLFRPVWKITFMDTWQTWGQ